MFTLLQDLRYALRVFGNNPGFTSLAVLTMALGIGPNTAIFSVVNSVLLRPLPYRNASRILVLKERKPATAELDDDVSYPNFEDWREQNQTFESMAAFLGDRSFNYQNRESAERLSGILVRNFFPCPERPSGSRPGLRSRAGSTRDEAGSSHQ